MNPNSLIPIEFSFLLRVAAAAFLAVADLLAEIRRRRR
jgi:hypothetical protein